MKFPTIFKNGVWHTTTKDRFELILKDGFILPDPPIDNSERWGTFSGPEHYPLVRCLDGVSLFDFRNFSVKEYSKKYPLSSWNEFVPFSRTKNSTIWLKFDPEEISDNFIDGKDLLSIWHELKAYGRSIMPIIETAHIGPLSTSLIKCIINYNKANKKFEKVNKQLIA